jgi:hypothetical protein
MNLENITLDAFDNITLKTVGIIRKGSFFPRKNDPKEFAK